MEILTSFYEPLLNDLKTIHSEAKAKANQALTQILVESYWKMGKRLSEESLTDQEKATTLTRLSKDLQIEHSLLTRVMKFYRTWPQKCPTEDNPFLAWSHYKILLSLQNELARSFYLLQANKNYWPIRTLSQKVKNNAYLEGLVKTDSTLPAPLQRRASALHVYKATVVHVVDGDTLVVNVDLGFDVWTKKRLRLRGINTSEMNADDPEEEQHAANAKIFVEERLPTEATIVAQTFKVDLHGRFVADIFYLSGETDKEKIFATGNFLNQELLDNGLAERV
ncbi:MAG: thermonuclease family protein [Candidatus Omnitrophica bacterium]|nr:thermonuclease family protein [Candidatus Omnitrophota bacterium]